MPLDRIGMMVAQAIHVMQQDQYNSMATIKGEQFVWLDIGPGNPEWYSLDGLELQLVEQPVLAMLFLERFRAARAAWALCGGP